MCIAKKISKTIGILKRLKHILPQYTRIHIYNALILYINYGLLLWGYNGKRIFALQKKAIRLIANGKYNAHTDPLFKKLNILKFKDLFELCHLKLYYKYSHHKLPSYFLEMISLMHVTQNRYNMRNMSLLQTHKVKHDYAKNVCDIIYLLS